MTRRKNGFTLIELIVIIVLVGIVASFLVVFMGQKISNAPDVVLVSQREANVERVMERIMADYLVLINGAAPDNALGTVVGNKTTYEALGALVDFEYITFNASGAEQLSGGGGTTPTTTLKVTVYVDPDGTGAEQHRTTILLTQARTTAGNEPVVQY